ncbi:MAG: hypothetical protein GY950_19670, partial [bacterium]|nr:hypothetical protein [bacterium]
MDIMKKIFTFFVVLMLFLVGGSSGPGLEAGNIMPHGIGTKALSMGGAFVGLADDASALF